VLNFFDKISIYQDAGLSILTASLAYFLYLSIFHSKRIKKNLSKRFGEKKITIYLILLQRCSGFLLYGIIPAFIVIISFSNNVLSYGLSSVNFSKSLSWTLGLSALIIPLEILNARNSSNQKKYPQIRTNEWNRYLLLLSASSWMIYLFAYEFLLRGMLFFSCLESFGFWPALSINVLIYAVFHLHKNKNEVIGSVLIGIVFCIMTFKTGTIWAAFFSHVILALSNEWASIYFNPEMKIKWSRKQK
jgi:membrane protease YdiL (CAAX protease family)